MEFQIDKRTLLSGLLKIQGITARKGSLKITEYVFLKATDSNIILQATDLETCFEGLYPADIAAEGSVVMDSKKIFEIVKDFPVDEINFQEIENKWVTIENETVNYHILGGNPDDFPLMPTFENVEFFEIKSAPLKEMIGKNIIIGPTDDNRPHIEGILFCAAEEDGKKMLRMISTDASRMSKTDYILDDGVQWPDDFKSVIIPKKGLNDVLKFLKDEGVVNIGIAENYIIFKTESEKIIIRLLEGDFPDFKKVIQSKDDLNNIKINRQELLMMMKRMSVFFNMDCKSVLFNFGDDLFFIEAMNPGMGEAKEDMPVEFKRDPIKVAFNPKYFIDALNVIKNETVILNIEDSKKPCIIEGEEDVNYINVIMPMKI